jgi:hypothetical protein
LRRVGVFRLDLLSARVFHVVTRASGWTHASSVPEVGVPHNYAAPIDTSICNALIVLATYYGTNELAMIAGHFVPHASKLILRQPFEVSIVAEVV